MKPLRRCLLVAVALCGGAWTPTAWSLNAPSGQTVSLRGCVVDGEYFAPVPADVAVSLPERGATRWVRVDASGRFVVAVPHQARVVLAVGAARPDAVGVDPTGQWQVVNTGAADQKVTGCLVLW